MVSLLLEIGLIVGIAAIISIIGRVIRQPPIVAYLITGVIAGPLFLKIVSPTDTLQSLAHLGVALLLFIVGISLDFRVLKQLGGTAVVGGLATMAVVTTIMFFIAQALGFQSIAAIYIAIAFSFSSTVVVVKILSDKKEIDSLHGQIALGILIIEDFVAAIALMIIPVISGGEAITIGLQISKAIGLIAGVFIFGRIVFPLLIGIAAKSQEILFLFSIAWALVISILFNAVGLSTEIGALIAGMVIASSKYSLEIKSKIKGVRDFFVILFFVFFGAQLAGPITGSLVGKAVLISIFILIGKPIIVMSFMRSFGFKKRTNFLAGTSLAQVSEFSLIVILLGFTLGHVSQEVFSLSILVALITIGISSYTMYFSHSIYKTLSRFLNIFDGKRHELDRIPKGEIYDVLLLGYNRVGFNLLKAFTLAKKKYLIIDYNPITILNLSRKGINCIYGDVNDTELLKSLNIDKVKIIISTIPEYGTNLSVLKAIQNKNVIFIPTSHEIQSAIELYKAGADYVIMPHFLGGDFMASMLVRDNFNKKTLQDEGKRHIKDLHERLSDGQEHPRKDFHGA